MGIFSSGVLCVKFGVQTGEESKKVLELLNPNLKLDLYLLEHKNILKVTS